MKERYESYKDSGVPWIGQVPQGWEVSTVSRHYDMQLGKMLQPNKESESDTYEYYLCAANLGKNTLKLDNVKQMWLTKKDKELYSVAVGDLLVVEGGDVGSCAVVEKDLGNIYIQNALHRVRPKAGDDIRFLRYWLMNAKSIGYIDLICNKATIAHFTKDKLASFPIPLPPLPEQRAIAGYLDERCAAIDAYVSSLEREANLARELKQAAIARAVTRGLDPNTPMRDSGIPWIGQVPQGWEVETFGKHFTFGKGLPITKADLVPEGIAVLSYGQIHAKYNKRTTISDNMVRFVLSDFISTNPKSLLNKGDFVFADTSEDIEGSGNFGFNDYADDIFAGYHTIIARPIDLAYPKYYAYLFQSRGWKSQVQSKVNGVKVYSITKEILKGTSILLPPLPEQRAIAGYLDARCAAIEAYVASLEREAGLARELKQREIADAVTGKVRVAG